MDLTTLIDTYCTAWNDPEPAARARLLAQAMTPDASYTDPTVHAASPAELLAHIERVREKRPGARVLRQGAMDAHHHVARFHWQVSSADGAVLREGIDIVTLSADGAKLTAVIGFFT
jgi:hypothetical protein